MTSTIIITALLLLIFGRWLLLKLYPPKPIVITPIKDDRIVIERMFVKIKPLGVRIWESDGVMWVRNVLLLLGLWQVVSWFF